MEQSLDNSTHPLFTTWFTEYVKLNVDISCSEKKKKYIYIYIWSPKSSDGAVQKTNVLFMPANTIYILHSMDQGVILTFNSYYLRKTFCKAIAVKDGDFSDGSG